MIILDGKVTSEKILALLKQRLDQLNPKPKLDIILVGDNPASLQYVNMKKRRAASVGIDVQIHQFAATATPAEIEKLVVILNSDPLVTGIMVQLPLPSHLFAPPILNLIDPKKDADGLTAANLGLLFQRNPNAIAPATPKGVVDLLDAYDIDLAGKNAVIIGRSTEVGIPLVALMMAKNATTTLCHSHTQNLHQITKGADIIISAVGKPKFITPDYVAKDTIIIDIGLSSDPASGKLVGDVDFQSVAPLSSFITPVPGGVGPMTIASLLQNLVDIASP